MYGFFAALFGTRLFDGTRLVGVAALAYLLALGVYAFGCLAVWAVLFTLRDPSGQTVAPFVESPVANVWYLLACLPMVRVLLAPRHPGYLLVLVPTALVYLVTVALFSFLVGTSWILLAFGVAALGGSLLFEQAMMAR